MRRLLVLALLVLGPALAAAVDRSSSAIALTPDGATLVVVNPDSRSVSLVDTTSLAVLAELAVGADPRTVAVADSGRRAVVANYESGTVSVIDLRERVVVGEVVVGSRPYGVAALPDGARFAVSVQGDDRVSVVDARRLAVDATLSVADRPSGLAVSGDGELLLVTHLLAGVVTVVDAERFELDAVIPMWPDSNLAQSVIVAGATAYLPHTRSNTANTALTFDTTVFPVVSVIDVASRQHLVGPHLSLDTLDPPGVGLPFDAALSPAGSTLWVVNAASNDVTVVDLESRQRLAHIEVGDNPRGIVLAGDGATAYVNNTLAGTVSVIDTAALAVTTTVEVTTIPLPPALLLGKRLFHSSHDPRLARDQWIACASCHFDGEHDGRTWTFGFAGPRNTTSLRGMIQTYPLRWSAEWDESADSEFAATREQFGSGLLAGAMHDPLGEPNTGRSYELDCLAAFVDSLLLPTGQPEDLADPDAYRRGKALFEDPVVGCAACHPAPYWTDLQVHDVGTAHGPRERLGPEIDTPSLRALTSSAPYLHDGSAQTLLDVLTTANDGDLHGVTSHLDASSLQDLVTYMQLLPVSSSACVECLPTMKLAPSHMPHRGGLGAGRIPAPQAAPAGSATVAASGPRQPAARVGGTEQVSGRVVSAATALPIPEALVTLRATSFQTTTGSDGSFTLRVPPTGDEVEVAAWADGYYIASSHVHVPASGLELELRRYHTVDNPDYAWINPLPGSGGASACGNCHPAILPQWQGNAHGGAISNPRFYSFYNGTDTAGTRPVAPGYLLDFPGTAGICATCHAPGAAVDAPFTTDMNQVRDQLTSGIHCDLCHKLGGAYLKPEPPASVDCTACHEGPRKNKSAEFGRNCATDLARPIERNRRCSSAYLEDFAIEGESQMWCRFDAKTRSWFLADPKHQGRALAAQSYATYPNMPGVLSLRVLRPPEGEQFFAGPYPDIHDPDTYLPLIAESALCAPCHQFSFWGTPIYTSYDEWLASPYADPVTGQTCQDCHMPPTGDVYFALPEQGGLAHPPETIASHLQVGSSDRELLESTVDLEVEAAVVECELRVTVTVTNTGAGHHLPTDHPGRHLILEVEATDLTGQPLPLLEGPTIPQWGGSYAGSAGTGYAKLLEDVVSGEWPVVSYWKQAVIRDDTRIPALGQSTTTYAFNGDSDATVTVRVLFRRLFEPIAVRYGWDLGEVVMAERTVTPSP